MLKRLILALSIFVVLITGIGFFYGIKHPALPEAPVPVATTQTSQSPVPSSKKTICLNMIVKNEAGVIRDCLQSVKGLIDCWAIVDTGSTDGTQEVIKESLKDIPGTLYERPWVNFSHNRNEALRFAKDKADYSLFIDADEVLLFDKNFPGLSPEKDVYFINVQQKDSSNYLRWFLVKNSVDWEWKGVLHELLEASVPTSQEVIRGVVNFSDTSRGARSRNPKKYLDDAATLIKGLEQEPNNTRYKFYLAQSYANAGELCLALEAYQKRAAVPQGLGYAEETFMSLYLIARIQELLQMPSNIVLQSYKKAHDHTPTRPEPLFYTALHHMRQGDLEKAYTLLKKVTSMTPSPLDNLFVEADILGWKANCCLAEAAWHLRKPEETLEACERVIRSPMAPEKTKLEMGKNIESLKALISASPR